GFQRHGGARRAGIKEIDVSHTDGTEEDAEWLAFGANKEHLGARRTREDVQKAIQRALGHPRADEMTNGQIAAHVGCTEGTIRNARRKRGGASSEFPKMRTVTRGGSTYSMNTENIGKGRAAEAETTTPAVGADEQPADEQARAADASAKRIERARKEDAASAKAPILDGENDPVPDHLRDDFASSALADYLEKLRGV